MTNIRQVVVEMAAFKLKAGATEDQLRAASDAIQEHFLSKQQGYLHRDLLKKSEREYVDIIHWASQKEAEQAMQEAMQIPACVRYFQLMEGPEENGENGVSHFSLLSSYR